MKKAPAARWAANGARCTFLTIRRAGPSPDEDDWVYYNDLGCGALHESMLRGAEIGVKQRRTHFTL